MKKILFIVFIFFFLVQFTYAQPSQGVQGGGGEDPKVKDEGQLKEAMENEQDADIPEGETVTYNGYEIQGPASYTAGEGFSTPEDSPIIGPDGNKYAGDGIQIENGEVKNADNFKLQTSEGKSEGRNTQDMNFNPPRYTIGSADYWKTPTHTVISGSGITKGDCFRVEEGQSVHADAVTSTFEDYEDCDDEFSVGKAKAVVVDNSVFSDIKNSSFTTDDSDLTEAHITSNKDNNTFDIDGVEVNLDKGDSADIVKNGSKYDVSINSSNGTIRDRYGNVACADISPGSRYRYVGNEQADFGVYIPSDANNFNLCMRTEETEHYPTNCSQCGVMDFYNQSFVLNGNYEYERKDAVDPRLFTDVIKADGNFSGNLSENAEDITYLYPGLGQTFSSIFEVRFWQKDEGFRFAGFNKPYIFRCNNNQRLLEHFVPSEPQCSFGHANLGREAPARL